LPYLQCIAKTRQAITEKKGGKEGTNVNQTRKELTNGFRFLNQGGRERKKTQRQEKKKGGSKRQGVRAWEKVGENIEIDIA